MQLFNLHTHSNFSDGKANAEDVVIEAVNQGLKVLGFSDHSPVPFENTFAIKNENVNNYISTIKSLKEKYQDKIDIYCSMEMDFIPGIIKDFKKTKEELGLDYMIGSVHLVGNNIEKLWFIDGSKVETYDEGLNNYFNGDIKKGVKTFFYQYNEMIETEVFDIVGHLDKIKMHNRNRYFLEEDKWYRDLLMETLTLIKEKSLIVEVNTRGIYKKRSTDFYPSSWILPIMREMNIPVVISSDAHLPNELTLCFKEAEDALKAAGYKETMCFKNGAFSGKGL
ncbi:MAG: histidinol-phosphatase [Bacteroidales bacterium]|nr:histidinol-phosphatase [Bacteroidales bacterium]